MLQVTNESPFEARIFILPDLAGIDTAYVTVKGTFEICPKGIRPAEEQVPIVPGDQHWGDPAQSSVRYAGEAHPSKPATDVVLVGSAYSPTKRPAPHFSVGFSVGKLKKILQVFGDRVWKSVAAGGAPSLPVPTDKVPLLWERAYGGRQDLGEGRILAEDRNPVGVGFQGKRSAAEMSDTPVANVIDPEHPIRSLSDRPEPAGCGFISPAWRPRVTFAGTYDETWRRKRAPYLPDDFDPRFFQAAPPDQIYSGYLQGGEPVEIVNASPLAIRRFKLPVCRLAVSVWMAGRAERPPMRIESLILEPDKDRFSLLWRGAVPCDKQALKIEQVAVGVQSLQGVIA